MSIDELNAFSIIRSIFKNGVADASKSENPLEKLCAIGDITKAAVFATGIQLSECKKVREMRVEVDKLFSYKRHKKDRQKIRRFENFEEVPKFQNVVRKVPKEVMVQPDVAKFGEIENFGGSLEFVYPEVHFCSCDYFRKVVLEKNEDWICPHIVASHIGKCFEKTETVPCNTEITNVLRKIAIRPFLSSESE